MSAEWLLAERSFRDLVLIDSRRNRFSNVLRFEPEARMRCPPWIDGWPGLEGDRPNPRGFLRSAPLRPAPATRCIQILLKKHSLREVWSQSMIAVWARGLSGRDWSPALLNLIRGAGLWSCLSLCHFDPRVQKRLQQNLCGELVHSLLAFLCRHLRSHQQFFGMK